MLMQVLSVVDDWSKVTFWHRTRGAACVDGFQLGTDWAAPARRCCCHGSNSYINGSCCCLPVTGRTKHTSDVSKFYTGNEEGGTTHRSLSQQADGCRVGSIVTRARARLTNRTDDHLIRAEDGKETCTCSHACIVLFHFIAF